MVNLVINSKCNLNCRFCFASIHIKKDCKRDMNYKEFDEILDFSKGLTASFCGGEPTLHPEFIKFYNHALENKKKVKVLTNGLWSDKVRDMVPCEGNDKSSFSLHVLEKNQYNKQQIESIHKTFLKLKKYKKTILVSFDSYNYDDNFLLELIEKYSIKSVYYSISVLRGADYISSKKDLKKWGSFIIDFIKKLSTFDVTVVNNCGYLPMCAYNKKQHQFLEKYQESRGFQGAKFKCDSPSYDFGIENQAWRCFMLKDFWTYKSSDFDNIFHLDFLIKSRIKILDEIMPFEECYTCDFYKEKQCGGGCYYYKLNKGSEYCFNCEEIEDDFIPMINKDIWKRVEEKGLVSYFLDTNVFEMALGGDEIIGVIYGMSDGRNKVVDIVKRLSEEYESFAIARNDISIFLKEMFKYGAVNFKKKL